MLDITAGTTAPERAARAGAGVHECPGAPGTASADAGSTEGDKGYVTTSQEELANGTGLIRQTVAKALGKWRRDGWLKTGRGRIVILNRKALEAWRRVWRLEACVAQATDSTRATAYTEHRIESSERSEGVRMKVAKIPISPKALKKLSAVRPVLPKEEREILDAIVLEEVTAHKLQSKVVSKAKGKTQVKAHKFHTQAVGKSAGKTEVKANMLKTKALGKAAGKVQVKAHKFNTKTISKAKGKVQVKAHKFAGKAAIAQGQGQGPGQGPQVRQPRRIGKAAARLRQGPGQGPQVRRQGQVRSQARQGLRRARTQVKAHKFGKALPKAKGKGQAKAHKFGKALPKAKGKAQAKAHKFGKALPKAKGKGQAKAHKFGKALPKAKGKGQAKAHKFGKALPKAQGQGARPRLTSSARLFRRRRARARPRLIVCRFSSRIETNDTTWTEPIVTPVVVDPNPNNNQPINQ